MSSTCGNVTCVRREHLLAELIKAALDSASSLDDLNGAIHRLNRQGDKIPDFIEQVGFEHIRAVVERTYDAVEQLGIDVATGKPREQIQEGGAA